VQVERPDAALQNLLASRLTPRHFRIYVANVTVRGKPGPAEARLRKIAEQLKQDRPLRQERFEHYVNVLAQQPGMQVAATVQPPTTTDGACEMVLEVKRKPFTFGTGVEWMSPGVRAIATATTNSLMLAKLTASHYRGVPENAALAPIGFESRYVNDSKRLGGTLSYPLILNNRHALTLTGGMYANSQFERYTQAVQPGAGRQVELSTCVRVASLEMGYVQRAEGVTRSATLGLYKGFDALGANRENNQNDLNFLRTRLLVSQANDLPFGFGIALSAAGQFSDQRLASSEQISFGGRFFGLGYPAGEVAGDKGWGASAELNRLFTVDFTYLKTLQPFLVADMARVVSNSVSLSHRTLQSLAIGLRFSDRRYYTMDVSVAQPVGDKPTNASHRSPRFNLLWSYQFD